MRPRTAILILLLAVSTGAADPASQSAAGAPSGEVWLLSLDGVINPFSARYLEHERGAAEDADATLVVIRLNTPGGLEVLRSLAASPTTKVLIPAELTALLQPVLEHAAASGRAGDGPEPSRQPPR